MTTPRRWYAHPLLTHGVMLVAGLGLGGWYFGRVVDEKLAGLRAPVEMNTIARPASRMAPLPVEDAAAFEAAATQAVRTVVYIEARVGTGLEALMGQASVSTGSGVIMSADGYIVTNHHVVENASDIEVTLSDKTQLVARLVGSDPNTDLAVLKVEAQGLPTARFGDSDSVRVGQWVLAIGNPFELTSTVTAGIISGKAREIGALRNRLTEATGVDLSIESFLQTDAAVNPGNSGGALVTLDGALVGINTAIATVSGISEGFSFAIPANLVRKVTADLIEFGAVQRAFIGVNIRDIDYALQQRYELPTRNGVLVLATSGNGAARKAGLQRWDIIRAVAGRAVGSTSELQEQVGRFRPGDKVRLSVLREGQTLDVEMQLLNRQGTTERIAAKKPEAAGSTEDVVGLFSLEKLGGTFTPLTRSEQRRLQVPRGLKVVELKEYGLLTFEGVQVGFVVTKVNGRPVGSVDELKAALHAAVDVVLIEGYRPDTERKTFYRIETEE